MIKATHPHHQQTISPNLVKAIIGILLIWFALLTSCVTQKRCNEKFPPSVRNDSNTFQSHTEHYHDSVVYVKGDSVVINAGIKCDSLFRAQMAEQTVKSGHITATISVKNGVAKVKCKDDSLIALNVKLKEVIKTLSTRGYHYEKPPPVEIYKTYWFDKVCRSIVSVLILFGLFKLWYRFKGIG